MDGEEAHNRRLIVEVMGMAGARQDVGGGASRPAIGLRFPGRRRAASARECRQGVSVGTPLCDADRAPWLARIAACIDGWREQGSVVVVTCSALNRAYRDIVVCGRDSVRLFHLVGSRDLIGAAAPTSCRVTAAEKIPH